MTGTKVNFVLGLSMLLIVLASFHFETNHPTSSFTYDGATAGVVVIAIVGIVLLFKLTSLWADILVDGGRIARKPRFPFDALIGVAIITNLMGYTASGEWFTGMGDKHVPSWLFHCGPNELTGPFISCVIALALLLRVYAITRALARSKKEPQTDA